MLAGIATMVPLVYMALFVALGLVSILLGIRPSALGSWLVVIGGLHVLCIFWIWALCAFYLVVLLKAEAVPQDQKVLWAVLLFSTSMLAIAPFWYLHIWRPSRKPPAAPS